MEYICWICFSSKLAFIPGVYLDSISAVDLKITDNSYGISLKRFQCLDCGFIFCPTAPKELVDLYREMDDADYFIGEKGRLKQARKIIEFFRKHVDLKLIKNWLDVGAGLGSLVEEVSRYDIDVSGLEPSKALASAGIELGRDLIIGDLITLSNQKYDVVSLLDVVEHVANPMEFVTQIASKISPGGYLVLTTPDKGSLAAQIMKNSWWHIRPAHVGYFDKSTISNLLETQGLKVLVWGRTTWYFSIAYIFSRFYKKNVTNKQKWVSKHEFYFPVNFRDSLLIIAKKVMDDQ